MTERIIFERKCDRCPNQVKTDAKKGFLGMIKRPKYPDGWEKIFDGKDLCSNCVHDFKTQFMKPVDRTTKTDKQ